MATNLATFTAAAGTPVEDYVSGSELTFAENSAVSSGAAIVTDANRARLDSGSVVILYADNFTPVSSDYDVVATLRRFTNASVAMGIGLRAGSAAFTGYYAIYTESSAAWLLYRGGSGTPLGSWADHWTIGDDRTVLMRATGGATPTVKVIIDGVERISVVPTGGDIVTEVGAPAMYLQGDVSNTTGTHIKAFGVADAGESVTLPLGYTRVLASDLWFNKPLPASQGARGYTNPQSAPFAELRLSTDHTTFRVHASTTIHGTFTPEAQVVAFINGVAQAASQFSANGREVFEFSGLPAGTKSIVVRSGMSAKPGDTVYGTFINAFEATGGTVASVTPPAEFGLIVVYGDSISVGYDSGDPPTLGWTNLLRDDHGKQVLNEGYGSRSLFDDCPDAAGRTALADRIAGYSPSAVWLAIGTNDYGLNRWTAANFGTAYSDLLWKLVTALPGIPIYCQTPLQRISPAVETANASGSTLGDYRTQIASAVAANPTCTLVDGAAGAIVSNGGMSADGLHPDEDGHAEYAAFVAGELPEPASGSAMGGIRPNNPGGGRMGGSGLGRSLIGSASSFVGVEHLHEQTQLDFLGISSALLANPSGAGNALVISSATQRYGVWFSTGGGETQPDLSAYDVTEYIEVVLGSFDDTQVAEAFANAVTTEGGFTVARDAFVVTLTDELTGERVDAVDVNSGVFITILQQGQ